MAEADIRWLQRFDNFQRALLVLERGVELAQSRALSELEQQGLIQGFEFTHELAWNLLKDFLQHQGIEGLIGSRDATRVAFQNGLIADGETWMAMIRARNQSSHTYNLEQAQAIAHDVVHRYSPAFRQLRERFTTLSGEGAVTLSNPSATTSQATGLPESAIGAIQEVLASHPEVEAAILYGSRALGRHRPASDIDLTLMGSGLDGAALGRIEADLDDLLLPWVIDLSCHAAITHPGLLGHIARAGQPLYRRKRLL